MRRPASARRRKLAVQRSVAFALTRDLDGIVLLSLFAGRRALSRKLTPGVAQVLAQALVPAISAAEAARA